MAFHISRAARDKYGFGDSLFMLTGNAIIANFQAAREFAHRINTHPDHNPETMVTAGDINAMGLIDEFNHLLMDRYRKEVDPKIMRAAHDHLTENLDPSALNSILTVFVEEFPNQSVYQGDLKADVYLAQSTGGVSHRLVVLEELIMLWLCQENPALQRFQELFQSSRLLESTEFLKCVGLIESYFDTRPPLAEGQPTLLKMMRTTGRMHPDSLQSQLRMIRTRWDPYIGDHTVRVLSGLDLIAEETKPVFHGPGPAQVIAFTPEEYHEPEQFSPDREWMPNLVIMAKNIFVWLDQLSRKLKREMRRLDDIPETELDILARRGFSGLWLIGVWKRSEASRTIKQLCGNPDAIASAYSLYDYVVAEELGGEAALETLRERAWKRGIRLASDMVPNHTGIDSDWITHHPEWFINTSVCPFPQYSFTGPDLASDPGNRIQIEDNYIHRTDAAVVFKHTDTATGEIRFIYHGNDGTDMPWNDTAQLNYLNPAVREAVIQKILSVARRFPIIRFDAAMTLARRHFRRLWFPEPGSGGAIPSRSEFSMSRDVFDRVMPREFWREVVDRLAEEAPDTLLLAEAFWLMEGYFVRTLGMHRVYNSAFMNMLRDEENAKYRSVMKNTMAFDSEVLKRFVNFMNNPDEKTAVEQFGKGDKYFGVCILMSTLPGLPMFGHGQIEGFAEKYGMEYYRAYWDESEDKGFIARHEREIFPLLHQRRLFSDALHFRLYDAIQTDGTVNEDVFAYSNRDNGRNTLVLVHNRFASVHGRILNSVPFTIPDPGSDEPIPVTESISDALDLSDDPRMFITFRDVITGDQFIHRNRDVITHGFPVSLDAYQYRVFMEFNEIPDTISGEYTALEQWLNGRGVKNLDDAILEMHLDPVLTPFRALIAPPVHPELSGLKSLSDKPVTKDSFPELFARFKVFHTAAAEFEPSLPDWSVCEPALLADLQRLADFFTPPKEPEKPVKLMPEDVTPDGIEPGAPQTIRTDTPTPETVVSLHRKLLEQCLSDDLFFTVWLVQTVIRIFCRPGKSVDTPGLTPAIADDFKLGKAVRDTVAFMVPETIQPEDLIWLIKFLAALPDSPIKIREAASDPVNFLFQDIDAVRYLRVHHFDRVLWFRKERLLTLVRWVRWSSLISLSAHKEPDTDPKEFLELYAHLGDLLTHAETAGYRLDRLREQVDKASKDANQEQSK